MSHDVVMLPQRIYWTAFLAAQRLGQERYPFRPLPAILADQSRRVRAMVAYAYQHVPYYREMLARLGLTPADFRTAADLARLPVLEREDIQRDPAYFFSPRFPPGSCLELKSGGTTGLPCTVRHETRALFLNAAHGAREAGMIRRAVGRTVGYRKTTVGGRVCTAREVNDHVAAHALFGTRFPMQRQYLSVTDPPAPNIELLNAFQPHVLHAHGSYAERLFVHARLTGQRMHLPRLLTYSSDGLAPAARDLITGQLGIPALGIYESVECFKIAFECMEHRGLHVNVDLCALRILDRQGHEAPLGESGDVIISNLVNRATVLLNYRLRDLATLLPDPCTCGRTLPLLSFIEGRADDWIELPSGELMHPTALRAVATLLPDVWGFQFVQQSPTQWTALLVPGAGCDRAAVVPWLRQEVSRALGFPVELEVRFVDHLETTPGGKVRPVLSLRARARKEALAHEALHSGEP